MKERISLAAWILAILALAGALLFALRWIMLHAPRGGFDVG